MGQRFPLERLRSYPHLSPEDTTIWNGFIDSPHDDLIDVEYDVHVGPTSFPTDNVDPETKQLADALTRRRADAVVYGFQTIYVVEIKPRAGLEAMGQALGYSWFYRRDRNPPNLVQPTVLTDQALPEIPELYHSFGVALWVVDLGSPQPVSRSEA